MVKGAVSDDFGPPDVRVLFESLISQPNRGRCPNPREGWESSILSSTFDERRKPSRRRLRRNPPQTGNAGAIGGEHHFSSIGCPGETRKLTSFISDLARFTSSQRHDINVSGAILRKAGKSEHPAVSRDGGPAVPDARFRRRGEPLLFAGLD
jgi:hypothetical protein